MIFSSLYRARRVFGMAPVRSVHPTPPYRNIVEWDRSRSWSKDQRAGSKSTVVRLGRTRRELLLQVLPINLMFRRGYIPGRFHKLGKPRLRTSCLFLQKTSTPHKESGRPVGKNATS